MSGPVLYWMSRDQRVQDNWAFLYARELAVETGAPLGVVFCLAPSFLGATLRQYSFMLKGLEEAAQELNRLHVPFFLLHGEPAQEIPRFIRRQGFAALVTDFDPLRIKRTWKSGVAGRIAVPFFEVDAHNVVPCWVASQKQEYGAYTLRPRLGRHLPEFLDEFPKIKQHPYPWKQDGDKIMWDDVSKGLPIDRSIAEVVWIRPGAREARKALNLFVRRKLNTYDVVRNDPVRDGQSNLSPYFHFGHLSAQRVATEVMNSDAPERAKEAFLEELITRRELSDNFCYYNHHYDSPKCFPGWSQKTLLKHRRDTRDYQYTLQQFELAQTHDELWNAAQLELVHRGKMHGYLRMYWAKKILEWTVSPERAMKVAIYLNDKYELDGRDPNGYAGIAWSIGGMHDRPWGERKVFGMVRYMSYNGCKSKFDVKAYITYVKGLK
jgi:deoxyribodipyrimidine photo-lyase